MSADQGAEHPKLERIRKLLAMAEAEELTLEARDSYNAKAAKLIAEYGIDAALLAETKAQADRPADRIITLDPPYALDKAALLWAVLRPLRCEGVRNRRRNEHGKTIYIMHVFAMEDDLDRAELLFTSLLVQAAFGLATERPDSGWENVAAFRRSWLEGFARAVEVRLRDAEKQAQERAERDQRGHAPAGSTTAGRSVALVLVDRTALVERAKKAAYPRLKTAASRSLSGSGYGSGHAAGQRADLGGSRLGGSGRRAVGR